MTQTAIVMTFDNATGAIQELMTAAKSYRADVQELGGTVRCWWSVVAGDRSGSFFVTAEFESASKAGELLDLASAGKGMWFWPAIEKGAVLASRSMLSEASLP